MNAMNAMSEVTTSQPENMEAKEKEVKGTNWIINSIEDFKRVIYGLTHTDKGVWNKTYAFIKITENHMIGYKSEKGKKKGEWKRSDVLSIAERPYNRRDFTGFTIGQSFNSSMNYSMLRDDTVQSLVLNRGKENEIDCLAVWIAINGEIVSAAAFTPSQLDMLKSQEKYCKTSCKGDMSSYEAMKATFIAENKDNNPNEKPGNQIGAIL